ncbi:MAG: hypothetical protein ACREO0_15370, partial [Pseudoxanthomonas sp.]
DPDLMSALFLPYLLGRLHLRNRIVMAPMTRARSPDGVPNELNALYYSQRASAGLIITEGTPISNTAEGFASKLVRDGGVQCPPKSIPASNLKVGAVMSTHSAQRAEHLIKEKLPD